MADSSGLPMSYDRFCATVPVGSDNRIWMGPLRNRYGTELHPKSEWMDLIEKLKGQPVSYANLRRVAG